MMIRAVLGNPNHPEYGVAKVASNVKPYQAADHIGKVLGDTAFVLPYSQELEEQYLAGNLLADLTLKDSRPFRKELERIIAEVF